MTLEFIKIFCLISGFIIGLGSVTVIELHGFLARKSNYWTLATTRTHKITKPLIWVGILMVLISGIFLYKGSFLVLHLVFVFLLFLNGVYLSFFISPFLLKREREGFESELLPDKLQKRIFTSLIFSDIGWWSSVVMFAIYILTN